MDITMDININIDINQKRDIAVTSHLYEHHDLVPNRIQKAIIRAAPNTRTQTWSNKAAENWSKLRESAQKSTTRHPEPLTTEQLDTAKSSEGDLFVVVGELLYFPEDSSSNSDKSLRPPSKTKTKTSTNNNNDGDQQHQPEKNVWASHLVCIKACNVRGNLYALVSEGKDGRSWNFLAMPQTVNDWVAYYPEFTGYPDEEQVKQHKTRRTVWKQRITAFCADSLGIKKSRDVPSNNNNKMEKTSSTVIVESPPGGNPLAPSRAKEFVQQRSAICVDYERSFQVTNRLLYTDDSIFELDKKEIEEITKECTTLWRLRDGHLTEECIREISQSVRKGLLVGKPALPPFQHQAFVLNCSVMGRSAARRHSVVNWDDIIEDAFDMAWNTSYPHPVDGRDEVWSSEVIVIDD